MVRRKKTAKAGSGETLAAQTDRHVLYEQSVQDVEQEAGFLEETYFEIRGRKPVLLREDFCGTASAASQWERSWSTRRSAQSLASSIAAG